MMSGVECGRDSIRTASNSSDFRQRLRGRFGVALRRRFFGAVFTLGETPTADEANVQYRETQKPTCNQRWRWIPVAPGAPSDLAKSAEVWHTKTDSISIAYEFRTKSAQSGGLEKNGRRERILGLGRCVAVRRFVREGPC